MYNSEKILHLITKNKHHFNCDVIDHSLEDCLGQPIRDRFVPDKPPGYKAFCQLGTVRFKKINKSVLNTIGFHLEDKINDEVNFNGGTLTFTLQLINMWTCQWGVKNLKMIPFVLEVGLDLLQRTVMAL